MASERPEAPNEETAAEPPVGGLRGALVAFENRNFRVLFTGRVTSNMARAMRVMVRGWMTLELTDSPFLMGVVISSLSWPMLVVPLIGGVLADRVDRKILLKWTEGLLTVLWAFTTMLVFFGAWKIGPSYLRIQWWHFIITSFLSGVIQSVGRPGHEAMIGSVVDKKRLPSAVVMDSVSSTWPGVIGPAVAAASIALLGGDWHRWGPWLFGLTALGQLVTYITILMLHWQPSMDTSKGIKRESTWRDFIEGIRMIRSEEVLSAIVVLGLTFMLVAGGATFLLPVFARDVYGYGKEGGAVALGALNTASAIGSSLGAMVITMLLSYRRRGKLLFAVALMHSASVIAFSQSTVFVLSTVLIAINSMTQIFFRTMQRMLMQMMAPDHMRGRVMSIGVMQMGLSPIGVLIWGMVAELMQGKFGLARGTQTTWLIGGVMYGVVAILYFTFVPALRRFK